MPTEALSRIPGYPARQPSCASIVDRSPHPDGTSPRRSVERISANSSRVPLGPLRERFLMLEEDGLMSRTQLARQLGWYRSAPPSQRARGQHRLPDTSRVSRILGLVPGRPKLYIRYSTATVLCRALDVDPVDLGL